MKNERKTEVKVGVMTLAGILVFLFVFGWAKNFTIFETKISLKVEFNTVAGLEVGDAVMVNGVKKGRVSEMIPSSEGVVVSLLMDEDTRVNEDASFSIMMLDLMGGKKIEITPGSGSPAEETRIFKGEFLGDISTAMGMLSRVQEDLINLTREMRLTLEKTNDILSDGEFISNLKNSFLHLNNTAEKLNLFISRNSTQLDSLITNTNTLVSETSSLIGENKSNLRAFLASSEDFLKQSGDLVAELNMILEKAEKRENNLGKILYDEKILDDMKNTLARFKELSEIIVEQLKGEGLKVDAEVDLF